MEVPASEEAVESVRSSPEKIALTAAQEEELDRRLEACREDLDPGEPWRGALFEIGHRKS